MKLKTLIGLSALAASASAFAGASPYDYLEGAVGQAEFGVAEGVVFSAAGSNSLSDHFFIEGGLRYANSDDEFLRNGVTDKISVLDYNIALGSHISLSDSLSLVGTAGIGNLELDHDGGSVSEDYTKLELGIRTGLTEKVQFELGAVNLRFDEDDETGFTAAIRTNFSDNESIGLEVLDVDDYEYVVITFRATSE